MIPERQTGKVGGKTDHGLSVRPTVSHTKPLRTKPEHPNYTNEIPNRSLNSSTLPPGDNTRHAMNLSSPTVRLLVDSEIDLSTRNVNAKVFINIRYLNIIKSGAYQQDRYTAYEHGGQLVR